MRSLTFLLLAALQLHAQELCYDEWDEMYYCEEYGDDSYDLIDMSDWEFADWYMPTNEDPLAQITNAANGAPQPRGVPPIPAPLNALVNVTALNPVTATNLASNMMVKHTLTFLGSSSSSYVYTLEPIATRLCDSSLPANTGNMIFPLQLGAYPASDPMAAARMTQQRWSIAKFPGNPQFYTIEFLGDNVANSADSKFLADAKSTSMCGAACTRMFLGFYPNVTLNNICSNRYGYPTKKCVATSVGPASATPVSLNGRSFISMTLNNVTATPAQVNGALSNGKFNKGYVTGTLNGAAFKGVMTSRTTVNGTGYNTLYQSNGISGSFANGAFTGTLTGAANLTCSKWQDLNNFVIGLGKWSGVIGTNGFQIVPQADGYADGSFLTNNRTQSIVPKGTVYNGVFVAVDTPAPNTAGSFSIAPVYNGERRHIGFQPTPVRDSVSGNITFLAHCAYMQVRNQSDPLNNNSQAVWKNNKKVAFNLV